jgi:integrase
MSKIKNWIMPGCKGRFYVRGKNNIIWYRRGAERKSLSLPFTPANRKIAADIIIAEENPNVYSPKSNETLNDYFIKYIEHSKTINYENTLRSKIRTGELFFDKIFSINETKEFYNYIVNKLSNSNYSSVSKEHYIKYIKAFFNWLISQEILEKNPFKDYKIKVVRRPIITYTEDELEKIFEATKKETQIYVIVRILYITAFRINELLNLEWENIIENGIYKTKIELTNKMKTKKEYFPINQEMIDLFEMLDIQKKTGKIFKWRYESYVRNYKNTIQELGIKKNTYTNKDSLFHYFRATRITEWVKKGYSSAIVSKLSRDNINTVMKYYNNLDLDDLSTYI